MTTMQQGTVAPVQKSVRVKADPARAFHVFTAEYDSWWPRTHHIGKSPMKKAIIEGKSGGRCYTEQVDGTECDWGTVLVWEPPQRFVLAWQITHEWGYEPDLAKSSEVEVRFSPDGDGYTRVALEHRNLERHGLVGGNTLRTAVDSEGGWTGLMKMYAELVERG